MWRADQCLSETGDGQGLITKGRKGIGAVSGLTATDGWT